MKERGIIIMKEKIEAQIRSKFLNKDGTFNKTVIVSFITLLIVLINQILAVFNVTPAHEDQIVDVINTLLVILGLLGFVEGPADEAAEVPHAGIPAKKQAESVATTGTGASVATPNSAHLPQTGQQPDKKI